MNSLWEERSSSGVLRAQGVTALQACKVMSQSRGLKSLLCDALPVGHQGWMCPEQPGGAILMACRGDGRIVEGCATPAPRSAAALPEGFLRAGFGRHTGMLARRCSFGSSLAFKNVLWYKGRVLWTIFFQDREA